VRYGDAIKVEEAMSYYTVSQPDGRGFPPHDDLVYEVGKTIRPTQEPSGHPRISARGKTYALPHYCSLMGRYPAAYLTAGNVATCIEVQQWPCRLFEVEGEAIKGSFASAPEEWHRAMEASWNDAVLAANRPFSVDDTDDRYRRQHEAHEAANGERRYRLDNLLAERYGGFRELTIVRELEPAHQVFGPCGADVVRLIERSKHLNALELERLVAAERCPYPISASTHSVDQAEASWWATKSLAVSDVIEEAAYEAGRRGAMQSAHNATGRGCEEEVWRATQPDLSEGPMHAFVAYHDAVEALVMKDVIAEECFEFLYRGWREVIDQQTNPSGE
jgi:hypothetical protein